MLRNYLKIAFRTLSRHKLHSLISISGLTLGIACCILIVLYVQDELSFDRFHERADRLYRAYAKEDFGENQQFFDVSTPFPMGPALKDNFEEVEEMTRLNNINPRIKIGDRIFTDRVTIVAPAFFRMFSFKIVEGDISTLLRSPDHIALTVDAAKQYFGNADALNQTMSIMLGEQYTDFVVKAIIENPPVNSSIHFSSLISDLNYPKLYNERLLTSQWFNVTPETYVLLREGADVVALQAKFPALFKTLLGDDFEKSKYFVGLQPLTSIHLDTSFPQAIAPVSDPKYSWILSGIAVLILSIACINFVTLSIGRSIKRAKEVGVRKVAGAQKSELMLQFVAEALLITLFSVVFGALLAKGAQPFFNDLAGKQLEVQPDVFMALVLVAITVMIGIVAGSYPAFVLSAFNPAKVFKGDLKAGNNKNRLRTALVGVQLVLSIFLISSTLLMQQQLRFIQDKNLGFEKDQLAVLPIPNERQGRLAERIAAGFEQGTSIGVALKRLTGVAGTSISSHDFGNENWTALGFTDEKGAYQEFFMNVIDPAYIPLLNIQLASGRNFSNDVPSDARRAIIVNETFVKSFGLVDGVGQRIPGKNFEEHEIIGVVKDFNFSSLHQKVAPLVLTMNPQVVFSGSENINIDNSLMPKLLIKLEAGKMVSAIEGIRSAWKKQTGSDEFDLTFADEAIAAQYRNEQNLGRMVNVATMITILIASLGLYGLASLAMQAKTREISIRKVLGATESSLLVLLSKDYFALIGVSLVVSIPFTYWLMDRWLQSFQYRIGISWQVFGVAGLIALVIAFVTIAYRAFRTAWTQPVDSLRQE